MSGALLYFHRQGEHRLAIDAALRQSRRIRTEFRSRISEPNLTSLDPGDLESPVRTVLRDSEFRFQGRSCPSHNISRMR